MYKEWSDFTVNFLGFGDYHHSDTIDVFTQNRGRFKYSWIDIRLINWLQAQWKRFVMNSQKNHHQIITLARMYEEWPNFTVNFLGLGDCHHTLVAFTQKFDRCKCFWIENFLINWLQAQRKVLLRTPERITVKSSTQLKTTRSGLLTFAVNLLRFDDHHQGDDGQDDTH